MTTRSRSSNTDTPHAASPQALWQAGFDAMTEAAQQAMGPLEGLFGQRVAKAMSQLGMPAPMEISALREQVQTLQDRVDRLEAALAATHPEKTAAPRRRSPRS